VAIPPLTSDGDLQHFPGAPYAPPVIHAAEASVRRDAGWHIAPVYRETVVVRGNGSRYLFLPTQRVVTVHSVTDQALVPVAAWRLSHADAPKLVVGFGRRWTAGEDFRVDMTHGFESADDLLPIVASRCQQQVADALLTQRSETVGGRTSSESYNINRFEAANAADAALGHYRLPAVA
jgi:hypothetical protein